MNRTYLFVPPEERSEVEALGALWDAATKCWYVEGAPQSNLARWSSVPEEVEYCILSNQAYVATTSIACPCCGQETEVLTIHCRSGLVLGEPLERFTVSDISAMDGVLVQQLKRWPGFRRTADGEAFGDFANHCAACGNVIGDIDLHSEPSHAFFDIVHATAGLVTLIPIPRSIQLSGNEHFVID
jgi:hypothetical protein